MRRISVLATLVIGMLPAASQASLVVYTDYASWQAAVHPSVDFNFENLIPETLMIDISGGLNYHNVTFKDGGVNSHLYIVGKAWNGNGYADGNATVLSEQGSGAPAMLMDFYFNVTAAGFDYRTTGNDGLDIETSQGDRFSQAGSVGLTAFVGFVSSTPVSFLTVKNAPNTQFNMLGFHDQVAPEPGTLSALALGGAVLAGKRRKAKRHRV